MMLSEMDITGLKYDVSVLRNINHGLSETISSKSNRWRDKEWDTGEKRKKGKELREIDNKRGCICREVKRKKGEQTEE